MLEITVWLIILYVSIYTMIYARQIYKEKNKFGAFTVGTLALVIIVLMFFIEIQ